jgi:outer membrane murein-binding lipoprotein Lpp
MKKIALSLLAFAMLLAAFSFSRALAHEEIEQGDVRIVGGWTNEPPYVNQINGIELNITRISNGQPINNALAQVDVSMRKGGETKPLEFQPTEEAGLYVTEILPTQTGQYAIAFQGTIAGAAFNSQLEIEDVGNTRLLEFPPASRSGGGVSDEVLEQLQTVITDLTAQVDQATTASEEAQQAAQAATESAAEQKVAADRAYLFGMVGVGVGVAGIIIGVAALTRGREAKALA